MAVNKINSRSPYYVIGAGSEVVTTSDTDTYQLKIVQVNADESTSDSPGEGTSGVAIKLRAIPVNFTSSGTYTWTGTGASGTTADIDVTVTLDVGVTNQEISYGCSTTDSDGNTITATAFVVVWATTTQYTARLTITNDILPSISSIGYTGFVTQSSSIQAQTTPEINKTKTQVFEVKGRNGDSYSFSIALAHANDYTSSPALTATPASFSGTFGEANVTLASTLTGTVSESARYVLGRSTTETIEGCPFKISLYTSNVPDNTLVPFTITGVSASDLVRGSLTGAFQVFNNGAELDFEAKLDGSAEGSETFTITLDGITNTAPNDSVKSVTILDSVTAGTPQEVQVSVTGKGTPNCACAETNRETAYFRSLTGGTELANGVFLFKNEALTIPYSSSGQYYNFVVGSDVKVGRIGATCDGRLSNLVTCNSTTDCGGSIIETEVNEALVSSDYVTNPGTDGSDVCALVADIPVYYVGSIVGNNVDGSGATLYTNRSGAGHISNPFGGTGNWYKIILTGSDGNPADFYCKIYGDDIAGGFAVDVTPCNQSIETGQEGGTTSQSNTTPSVSLSMSTSDGNNQGKAYVSQRTVLTASSQNITNPSYQWSKADSGGTLSDISGATSQQLVINESGGGGETQTTTGTKIYNCSVSGTSDTSDLQIIWENRTQYSAKFSSSLLPSKAACSGTPITLYADRNGANEFCLATAFFEDATGQTLATTSRTYSNSTDGSNGSIREISGSSSTYTLGPCGNNSCTDPVDPTSGTIQKLALTRCSNQTSAGATEYFVFKDFSYNVDTILHLKDFGQTGGEGCYTIVTQYEDTFAMPNGTYIVESAEKENYIARLQPFGDCDTCVNQIEEESTEEVVEQLIDPNKFYGAYRLCGVPEGTLEYIVSDSELELVFRVGNATNTCKSLAISGNDAYNEAAGEYPSNAQFFNDCATCLGGTTPSSTGLTNKRVYQLCTDTSQTLVVGTGTSGYSFPDVIKFEGLSYFNPQASSDATVINVEDLVTYRDCTAANYVPPTVTPTRPSSIKVMRISLTSALNSTAACNTLNTYDVNVYYVGTFGDNTYLYSDPSLSTLYAPTTETNFRINENRNYFRIGYTGMSTAGIRPGAVYDFGSCSSVNIY